MTGNENHQHHLAHSLYEAAIEAELAMPPETEEQAKRSLLRRALRIGGGVILLVLGVVMMVTPGPGLIAIAGGLLLLSEDVPFAARLLEKVRERIPENEDGKISPWVWVVSGVFLVLALVISISVTVYF